MRKGSVHWYHVIFRMYGKRVQNSGTVCYIFLKEREVFIIFAYLYSQYHWKFTSETDECCLREAAAVQDGRETIDPSVSLQFYFLQNKYKQLKKLPHCLFSYHQGL